MTNETLPQGVEFITEAGDIAEYRLANGLKILLVENRVAPVVTVMVLYRVGSRNEAVGYTGATHLLEHLMFKGTPTFNKTQNTQIAGSLQRIGADFNATTWYDRTNYFETVPSDQLAFAIKLEADRMRHSFIADEDRQSEMTVVRNELERGQNDPASVLDEAVYATAFREHPYHHPTIGWRTDVEGVPTARLKKFYDTFYHPDNATVIIVGDFERAATLTLLQEHFGAYQPTGETIPEVYTAEPPQEGERRLVIRRAGELASIQMAWRTPAALGHDEVLSQKDLAARAASEPTDNDIYPLVLLSQILTNGITSRLYQALVETQLAVDVYANCDQHRDPGLFNIVATVAPESAPEAVEKAILDALNALATEGPDAAEVAKAQRQILAMDAFSRDGTHKVAMQLSEAEAVADWRFFQNYAQHINRVTAEDVRRVARHYFTADTRTVGYFIPKTNGANALAAHAGSPQLKFDDCHDCAAAPSFGLWNMPARRRFPHGVQFYNEPDAVAPALDTAAFAEHAAASDDETSALSASDTVKSAGAFASRITRTQLANGAVLLQLLNRATPTVALRGSLRAGSFFQPAARVGLASMTAQMLERGTRRRDKLALAGALENAGASLDFATTQFALSFTGRALSPDLPMVLELLAEMLREPAFPADELEKLKQQNIAAIKEQSVQTRYRAFQRFAEITYPPGSPFYMPPSELLMDSINSLTVADLEAFYTQQYGGRSLILALAGDFEADAVREQFAELLGDFTGPADVSINVTDPPALTAMRRDIVSLKDKANVDIMLGAPVGLRRHTPDFYAAMLANSALGESTLSSRLGLKVRDEEGLTYGIGSRFLAPSFAAGPWYISVSVNPQNVERAIASALDVVRGYALNGIRADELADEKSAAIGSAKVALATNGGLAAALWSMEFEETGLDHIDNFAHIINEVTVEAANAAIKQYFNPDALTIVMAGDL